MAVDCLKANGVSCACLAVEDSRARCPSRRRISQCATLKGNGSGSTQHVLAAADCLLEDIASNYANDALPNVDGSVIRIVALSGMV